jgi:hypothetical protein
LSFAVTNKKTMDKKKKGLADTGQGDFILNESGTSVNVDNVEDTPKERSDDPSLRPDNNPPDGEPFIPRTMDDQKDITD